MKAKLAIVIVNYNVRYFLRQCLSSVFRSIKNLDARVYVVDNHSQDGSNAMIAQEFTEVILIPNEKNLGFGKANNQVLDRVDAEYLLYLNPDTIITEDVLQSSISFMDEHQDAGALGVKLLDGGGNYHQESKRGFPSVFTAISKLTGLYKLSPKSKLFNYYYMGHLDEDSTSEVDVLCGAYIFTRTPLMQELGGFDEDFFMYGEDIDLCYRIKEAGHKIYYIPNGRIIHFKGESSKKLSYKYIKSFYGAMITYLKKRHTGGIQSLLLPIFSLTVMLYALIKSFINLSQKWFRALFDTLILYFAGTAFSKIWGEWYHHNAYYFSNESVKYLMASLSVIFVLGYYIAGKYDDEKSFKSLYQGFVVSSVISFLIYAFMPESFRSSRILVLATAILALIYLLVYQLYRYFRDSRTADINYLIVGSDNSSAELMSLLKSRKNANYIGFVSPSNSVDSLGKLDEILQITNAHDIGEIIFSPKDLSFNMILDVMIQLGSDIRFKLASEDNVSILGSHSAKKQGEIFTVDLQLNLNNPVNRRVKRLSDVILSLLLILLLPFLIFLKNYRNRVFNLFESLIGFKSVIGFKEVNENFPSIKRGVFTLEDIYQEDIESFEFDYAKRYSLLLDIEYLIQALKK